MCACSPWGNGDDLMSTLCQLHGEPAHHITQATCRNAREGSQCHRAVAFLSECRDPTPLAIAPVFDQGETSADTNTTLRGVAGAWLMPLPSAFVTTTRLLLEGAAAPARGEAAAPMDLFAGARTARGLLLALVLANTILLLCFAA